MLNANAQKNIHNESEKKYQINLSPINSDSVMKKEPREGVKDNSGAPKNDQNEVKIVEKSVKSFLDKAKRFGGVKSRLSKFGRSYLSMSEKLSNNRNGLFRAEPLPLPNDVESNTYSSVKQSSFSCK